MNFIAVEDTANDVLELYLTFSSYRKVVGNALQLFTKIRTKNLRFTDNNNNGPLYNCCKYFLKYHKLDPLNIIMDKIYIKHFVIPMFQHLEKSYKFYTFLLLEDMKKYQPYLIKYIKHRENEVTSFGHKNISMLNLMLLNKLYHVATYLLDYGVSFDSITEYSESYNFLVSYYSGQLDKLLFLRKHMPLASYLHIYPTKDSLAQGFRNNRYLKLTNVQQFYKTYQMYYATKNIDTLCEWIKITNVDIYNVKNNNGESLIMSLLLEYTDMTSRLLEHGMIDFDKPYPSSYLNYNVIQNYYRGNLKMLLKIRKWNPYLYRKVYKDIPSLVNACAYNPDLDISVGQLYRYAVGDLENTKLVDIGYYDDHVQKICDDILKHKKAKETLEKYMKGEYTQILLL